MVSEVLQILPSFNGNSNAGQINQPTNNTQTIKDFKNINNIPMWKNTIGQMINELTIKDKAALPNLTCNEVTQWSFLKDTFLEKAIDKTCLPEFKNIINNLDKSVIDTKIAQNAVKNVFDVELQEIGDAGKLVINAGKDTLKSKAGTIAANALGMTTKGGLLLSAVCEYSDLKDAAVNGDFCKQTVRSGAKIAITPFLAGVAAQIIKAIAPPPLKTFGMVAGMFAGSYIGSNATNAAADLILGKSIKSQMKENQNKFAEMQYEKALQQA